MTRGKVRRLGAAGVVLGCLIALPSPAGADAAQKFTITGPATINEGGTATYVVSLSDGADADATVDFGATAGAGTSSSDFTVTTTPSTLTVPKGGTRTITVQANEDTTDEVNEPFTVSLSNAVRATIDTGSVTTNIIDNDTPGLSIDDASANEGDAAHFTISLSQPAASNVTVTYGTANGTRRRSGRLHDGVGDTHIHSRPDVEDRRHCDNRRDARVGREQ